MREVPSPRICIFFSLIISLLLIFLFLLTSCGKKGDPTLKAYEKPASPSGFSALHRESKIILSWNFPKNLESSIKGFYLLKSATGDFEKLSFLESNQRTFTDTNFSIGSEYRYKIISESMKNVLSDDSIMLSIKPKNPPDPPHEIQFNVEYNSLILSWSDVGEGILYNVYKSEKQGEQPPTSVNPEPIGETFFKDSFNVNKKVYYTIRSLTGSDIRDEGSASEEIVIDPGEFVPSAPGSLQAVPTRETIHIVWKEPAETWVTSYKVYRELDEKEGYVFIGSTFTTSYQDTENPLLKRNYRVTALGPAKEGPPAEIRDVVFIPTK
jgi:fibronectin type 3 domain-containing protein